MKQMVDPEGRHWDWDYNTNTWVPAQQGVFADAPAGGTAIKTHAQHVTPEGTFIKDGSSWFHKNDSGWEEVAIPSTASATAPQPVVAPYVALDLRDHFDCPACGDAVVLRHVIRRTGREQIQCMGCEEWHEVVR